MGVTQSTISCIERGRVQVSAADLAQLAKVLAPSSQPRRNVFQQVRQLFL